MMYTWGLVEGGREGPRAEKTGQIEEKEEENNNNNNPELLDFYLEGHPCQASFLPAGKWHLGR